MTTKEIWTMFFPGLMGGALFLGLIIGPVSMADCNPNCDCGGYDSNCSKYNPRFAGDNGYCTSQSPDPTFTCGASCFGICVVINNKCVAECSD